jgi:hypothetical protein
MAARATESLSNAAPSWTGDATISGMIVSHHASDAEIGGSSDFLLRHPSDFGGHLLNKASKR